MEISEILKKNRPLTEEIRLFDQVYSNTRVPTQVNTYQDESTRINTSPTRINTSHHESTRVRHGSTRIKQVRHESTLVRHESTRINTSPKRVNTSQLDQETITVYRSFSW